MGVMIHVQLHTILQRESADGLVDRLDLEMPDGSSFQDLLAILDIKLAPDSLLLVVNGRMADIDQLFAPGDQVHLMPAISGG
jgi:sulfur carrier protein ThiS